MMIWFVPYAVVSVVHLVLLGVEVEGPAGPVTKSVLMPLLVVGLLGTLLHRVRTEPPSETPPGALWPTWLPLVLLALAFSWFGDLALLGDGDTSFLLGLGFFLVAQLVYIVVYRQVGDPSVTSSRSWLVAPYAVWYVGFLIYFVVATEVEPTLAAVAVYGFALGAMAYLAHRVNGIVAIGAALFLISDSLIGLRGFADLELPLHSVWVMSTYTLGQALIVIGLLRRRATEPHEEHAHVQPGFNRTSSA